MSNDTSLLEYHKSISEELESVKNRVRHLIGDKHWASEGEYRETVLRKVLSDHLPQMIRASRGFVFYENAGLSHQIDILVFDRNRPTLFHDGDLAIVTPDTVRAIVEVKASINFASGFHQIVRKLADDAQRLRENVTHKRKTWVGLFAYESASALPSVPRFLETLQRATAENPKRIIDSISLGANGFIRYVHPEDGHPDRMPNAWIYHHLPNLSRAYFVSHAVWSMVDDDRQAGKFAWFPINGAAKKYGKWYIGLGDKKAAAFPSFE